MFRVPVNPALFQWACDRAGVTPQSLEKRFPKLPQWLSGELQPTFKQLEAFSAATHAPLLAFFDDQPPPPEKIPIPDFRTDHSNAVRRPSLDLLETIHACQLRQEWYRDYALGMDEDPLPFVGAVSLDDDVATTAANIRQTIALDLDDRARLANWAACLRRFIDHAEEAGILVMVSGIVGNNTQRKLDPREFRGFALADDLAPLIFINGADTRAAQMFTLAHELAHIWLGRSALSDAEAATVPKHAVERWCNQVAAELLVPMERLRNLYQSKNNLLDEKDRLAKAFKVSTLVILRRLHDAGYIPLDEFIGLYQSELAWLKTKVKTGAGGGDFYQTETARVGKRFARALIGSTLEGTTLHRDAFQMLGISKSQILHELGRRLEII